MNTASVSRQIGAVSSPLALFALLALFASLALTSCAAPADSGEDPQDTTPADVASADVGAGGGKDVANDTLEPEKDAAATSLCPAGQLCDDGNPCTFGDQCVNDQCKAGLNLCECQESADCAKFEDGNKCNGTLYCDKGAPPYRCRLTVSTIVACPAETGSACATNACDPKTGQCALTPVAKGSVCEDGDPCTPASQCDAGQCVAVGGKSCECESDGDCAALEDGNQCNGTLFCNKTAVPYTCKLNQASVKKCAAATDGACVAPACDPKTGTCAATNVEAIHDPCAAGAAGCTAPLTVATKELPANWSAGCQDGDECTVGEQCKGGKCAAETASENVCLCKSNADCAKQDDGDLCNGFEYCDTTLKQPKCVTNLATVIQCKSALDTACTKNSCVKNTGKCAPKPIVGPCDDGNKCTDKDLCAAGKCVGLFTCKCTEDKDCDGKGDGNKCNGAIYCDKTSGTCQANPATVVTCQTVDDTACVKSACAQATGDCALTHIERAVEVGCADDGTACRWEQLPKGAPDNSETKNALCDDGKKCTAGDVCAAGKCEGKEVVCECTEDTDCAAKDDGDKCNGTWFCNKAASPAKCTFNKAKVYCAPQPGGGCLTNACDKFDGECKLQPKPNKSTCTTGGLCVTGANCEQGKCVGTKVDCDDEDACTFDNCDPKTGCVNVTKKCTDGNQCTVDKCDTDTGVCSFTQTDFTLCDADGSGCTVNDLCLGGVCKAGKPVACAQPADPCQKGVCVSKSATEHTCGAAARKEDELCAGGKHCKLSSVCDKAGKCIPKGEDRLGSQLVDGGKSELVFRAVAVTDYGYEAGGVLHVESGPSVWIVRRFDKALKPQKLPEGPLSSAYGPLAGVHGLVVSSDGSQVVVGAQVSGKAGAGPNYNFVMRRREADAKVSWTATYDVKVAESAIGTAVVEHAQGGYVATGWGESGGKEIGYVLRASAQGGLQMWRWTTKPTQDHRLLGVVTDPDGYIYACGATNDGGAKERGWVAALSGSGKVEWQTTIKLEGDVLLAAIAHDVQTGDLFVVGNNTIGGVSNVVLAALDEEDGTVGDVHELPVVATVRDLSLRQDGLLLLAGDIAVSKTASQPWIAAYDVDGTKVWAKNYQTPSLGAAANAVVQVPYDGFAAVGVQSGGAFIVRADDWGANSCLASGVCAQKSQLDCHDLNQCTTDSCHPTKGCVNTPNTLPCEDGDLCTEGEKCVQAKCANSQKVDCDDGNVCTSNSCSKKEGCVVIKLSGLPCKDALDCTVAEKCVTGTCATSPPDCDDKNPCTKDVCYEGVGCSHETLDKVACGTGKVCAVGTCVKLWATQVSVGQSHACVVDGGGEGKCWGNYTAIGSGKKPASGYAFTTPLPIVNIDPIAGFDSADNHMCALTTSGQVFCWGYNQYGETGQGVANTTFLTPQGTKLTAAVHVATNHRNSCAAAKDGKAYCWGSNANQQTGRTGTSPTFVPTAVAGITDAVAVSVGYAHSCVLGKSGKVHCFGNNGSGQLGIGHINILPGPKADTNVPQTVKNIGDAVSISTGIRATCAIRKDGSAWCWGDGASGGLGNGSQSVVTTPEKLLLPQKAKKISLGNQCGCAIQQDNTLRCWGANTYGQLGTGNKFNTSTPILVKGLTDVVDVAIYQRHACAVRSNGEAYCWGDNSAGAIGNGKAEQNKVYPVPQLVPQSKQQ